jgi:aryl-alcohol dehydrogenase-like predicted oxidoreductase
MLLGRATPEGTRHYVSRHAAARTNSFYRDAQGLHTSSLGIGSYLGEMTAAADERYTAAMLAALRSGINFIDTSLNYRHQRSERVIGQAILCIAGAREIDRDEYIVCTKAGYLVPGAVPEGLLAEDIVGGMHSLAPVFLRDQLERSRVNLGIETVDVFYLHNPETQLQALDAETFYTRVRAAFETLEGLASEGRIQYYGAATWQGFRVQNGLSLHRLVGIAQEIAGDAHRFRFIQLPFNVAMPEAFTLRNQDGVSTLAAARDLGVTVVASASLLQARLVRDLPAAIASHLGEGTNAQRAVQFTRSTPGVTVALVGMSRPEHVQENAAIALTPPMTAEQYLGVYEAMR